MRDLTGIAVIGLGIFGTALALHFLGSAGDAVAVGEDAYVPEKRQPWPMQIDDPNTANAYNRAAYRDQTLKIDEIYNNPQANFTNDFLKTYAPSVKQSHIPIQQL